MISATGRSRIPLHSIRATCKGFFCKDARYHSSMVNYRRNRLPGGTYFFTVTLRDRRSGLLVQHIDLLREAFRAVREQYPFRMDAIVILPDHLHALWTLPDGDADYPSRWRAVKSRFSRRLLEQGVKLVHSAQGDVRRSRRRCVAPGTGVLS